MKFALYVVFIVTIMLFVSGAFELCLCDEHTNWGEKEQQALFDRYKIPESLRRYEDIALHLHRMSWYVEVARKDNWQEATRHPVLYKKGLDLSNVEIVYCFGTMEKEEDKFDFYLVQFVHGHAALDAETELDLLLFGCLNLHSDGVPRGFWSNFHYLEFDRDKDEISFDDSVWKNGKFVSCERYVLHKEILDKEILDEEAFHKDRLEVLKEIPVDDIRLSVLNKKPIPPITLEAENEYTIQIPQHIHPDTRKVFLRVIKKYKVLKSGQVKKLLEDLHPDLSEYDDGE
ncbi:MAG: hypothetical protein LBJ00_02530, partial [Planctomycetaceae bacterium]|nr:hypothetical protein [Planctomycetaceae bacterium]